MRAKLSDIKFKIGNSLIAANNTFKICTENGLTEIWYFDTTDEYVKRIEVAAPTKDVEIIIT